MKRIACLCWSSPLFSVECWILVDLRKNVRSCLKLLLNSFLLSVILDMFSEVQIIIICQFMLVWIANCAVLLISCNWRSMRTTDISYAHVVNFCMDTMWFHRYRFFQSSYSDVTKKLCRDTSFALSDGIYLLFAVHYCLYRFVIFNLVQKCIWTAVTFTTRAAKCIRICNWHHNH